jgi:ABC-type nitrate/sulfonate/bicarbonate transport system substrate-binding protein
MKAVVEVWIKRMATLCLVAMLLYPGLALGEKIRIAYAAVAATQAPVWVALDQGFFRREGLDVEMMYIRSGPLVLAALLSGDIAFASVGGAAVLSAIEQKADIRVIAIPIKKAAFSLVTAPAIKNPSDLIGKKVGITRFGGLYDFGLRYALRQWKIPANQVHFIQVGGISEIVAAVQSGQLDAAVLADPASFKAMEYGYKELLNFATLDVSFPMNAVIARERLLQENHGQVSRFTKAYVDSIVFMKTERAKSTAVIKRYTRIEEKDLLDKTYDLVVGQHLLPDPSPDAKVLQSAFQMMGKSDSDIRSMNLPRYIAPEFVEAAKKSAAARK